MRHPLSGQFLAVNLLFVLAVSSLQTVYAAPQASNTKPQPLTATRHALQARVTFPSYQLNPSTILWPPNCAAEDPNSCLGSTTVKGCTVEYCSKKVALTCWTHVYAIDLECLCNSMNSSTCSACASGINNQLYLAWLACYCPLDPGWSGLPADWNTTLPGFNILDIGQQVSSSSGVSIYFETDNPFTSQFITDKHDFNANATPPSCASSCNWLDTKWNTSIVDGDVATGLAGTNLFPANYTIGGAPQSSNLYLDLALFCVGWSWSDFQGNCTEACNSNLDNTGLLEWLDETCGNIPGFNGLSSNWRDSLWITNSTYPALAGFNTTWPNCLKAGDYPDCQLNTIESNCSSTRCSSVDQRGNCNSVSALGLECFCSQVKYGVSCTGNCILSWERVQLLNWFNETCFAVGNGTSLPRNWTSLLPVQRSEMLPWGWSVASDISPSAGSQHQCPSASEKLWAFAAVNIAMLLLIPFISRRTVIKKVTWGYFGRQESRRWYYTGLAAVGLHLSSNTVNAVIIQRTAGYENTNIKDLTFFWCTRPRLAWLVVALLPYQAEKAMYFSATSSILFSEVILQLFGAYNMVIAANYARRQKFLLRGHLAGNWYAKEAMIMYAGSMLWLTAVPFAIAACLWSVFGVSERIGRLSEYWIVTRRAMKENCAIANKQVELLNAAKEKLKPTGQIVERQQVQGLKDGIWKGINDVVDEWEKLTDTWKRMPTELRTEQKARRMAKKKAVKAKDRLGRTREGTERWRQRSQDIEYMEQEVVDVDREWFRTPETRQGDARESLAEVERRVIVDPDHRDEILEIIEACKNRMLQYEHAIAETQAKIAEDNAESRSIEQEVQILMWRWRWKWRWRFVNWQLVLHLRNQQAVISRQRKKHERVLSAAQNSPQLKHEIDQAADLQAVLDAWSVLFESKEKLKQNWEANEDEWKKIEEKREEAEKKPNMGRFLLVVVVGMLLCWIAQWLWWAGYIGVAGDRYCPPKLPALASIWTLFSATGSTFGASF